MEGWRLEERIKGLEGGWGVWGERKKKGRRRGKKGRRRGKGEIERVQGEKKGKGERGTTYLYAVSDSRSFQVLLHQLQDGSDLVCHKLSEHDPVMDTVIRILIL